MKSRKGKVTLQHEMVSKAAVFALPDHLSISTVSSTVPSTTRMKNIISEKDFSAETSLTVPQKHQSIFLNRVKVPVDEGKRRFSWKEIVAQREKEIAEIEEYRKSKEPPAIPTIFLDQETDYVKEKIFPCLLPCLERTVKKAIMWNGLGGQNNFFNGIDQLSECLWNNNPKRLKEPDVHIFNMDWVRQHLNKDPRKIYPKAWLWPQDYAANVIQRNVRKLFVTKDPDVSEMRNFWKKLEFERANPSMMSNPMFLKNLAASWDFTQPSAKNRLVNLPEDAAKPEKSMTAKSVLNVLGH